METPPEPRRRRPRKSRSQSSGNARPPETLSARLTRLVITLLLGLLGIGLLLGTYQLGRRGAGGDAVAENSPKTVVADGEQAWPRIAPSDLEFIDRVFELIGKGETAAAREVLEARKQEAPLAFLDSLYARTFLKTEDPLRALPHLQASVAKGEMVSASLLEISQAYLKNPLGAAAAMPHFAEAIMADPLSPYAFFYYGEALRQSGRSREAVQPLRQALLRARRDSEFPFIQNRYALARIEAEDPAVVLELEAAVKAEEPVGNQLVAAAALAAKNSDYAKAATLLERAQSALSRPEFRYLVNDQIFELSRDRPEMRKFF